MTREEWKNYKEFELMRLEMIGGARIWPSTTAAVDMPREFASDKVPPGPAAEG